MTSSMLTAVTLGGAAEAITATGACTVIQGTRYPLKGVFVDQGTWCAPLGRVAALRPAAVPIAAC